MTSAPLTRFMCDLLFRNSETIITIAADPKCLGARIGLHIWGSGLITIRTST
jgi:hypothetical protein